MGIFSRQRLYQGLPVPSAPLKFDLNIMRNPTINNFRFPMGANFRTDISQNMREARYYTSPSRNQSDFNEFEKLIGVHNQFNEQRAASCLSRINANCKSTENKKSLLHVAAERGNLAATAFLISAGVCIDTVDDEKNTPLMGAVKNNQLQEAMLLVESGANMHTRNEFGESSIDISLQSGGKCYEYLDSQRDYLIRQQEYHSGQEHSGSFMNFYEKKIGSKTYRANLARLTTLMDAPKLNKTEFNRLCDTVDINKSHYKIGNTLLHEAAKRGNIEAIDCLLERGAEIEAVAEGRHTPLLLAVAYDKDDAAMHLFKKGANIFARTLANEGVLQVASSEYTKFYEFVAKNIGAVVK